MAATSFEVTSVNIAAARAMVPGSVRQSIGGAPHTFSDVAARSHHMLLVLLPLDALVHQLCDITCSCHTLLRLQAVEEVVRIAQYYMQRGEPEKAADMWAKAGQPERAVELYVQVCVLHVIRSKQTHSPPAA
jgi:hypothetical protein